MSRVEDGCRDGQHLPQWRGCIRGCTRRHPHGRRSKKWQAIELRLYSLHSLHTNGGGRARRCHGQRRRGSIHVLALLRTAGGSGRIPAHWKAGCRRILAHRRAASDSWQRLSALMAALNDAHQHALHNNIYHFADCEESAKFLKPARSDCVHGVCMYRDPSTCTCKLYGLTHTLCTYTGVLKSRDCNLGARMVRVSDAGAHACSCCSCRTGVTD